MNRQQIKGIVRTAIARRIKNATYAEQKKWAEVYDWVNSQGRYLLNLTKGNEAPSDLKSYTDWDSDFGDAYVAYLKAVQSLEDAYKLLDEYAHDIDVRFNGGPDDY